MTTATNAASRDSRHESISNYLSLKSVPPKQQWLESFLRSVAPSSLALNALQQTAYNQILTTDITTSIQPSAAFPSDISNPNTIEQRLPGPFLVQVLDVEDIGISRWSQVEAIDAQERGETTRGREVIRILPDEQSNDGSAAGIGSKSNGPHRLCLQDVRGSKVYAFELKSVTGINTSMSIGCKMVLQNVHVARGLILLEQSNVRLLGGVVSVWDSQWKDTRKERLRLKVES